MSLDYADYEYYLAAAQLILAMLGMGATLTLRDFLGVVRAPQGIVLIVLTQLILTPLLALGMAHGLSLPAGFAVGLLMIAAMPGGSFSNIFTYLGRGNVPLSIAATGISTLGCLATTALVLETFGASQLPGKLEMPVGRIMFNILFCLLLPLAVGMGVRRFLTSIQGTVAKVCIRSSLVVLLMIVVGSLTSGRLNISAYGFWPPVALVLFGAISLIWCYIAGLYLLRASMADSFTIGIEVTVRNGNLALLLKATLFPAQAGVIDPLGDAVLFVILFYSGAALVIATGTVMIRRTKLRLRGQLEQPTNPHPTEDSPTDESQTSLTSAAAD